MRKKEKRNENSFFAGMTTNPNQTENQSNAEELEMMKLMGFSTFDSTKNKQVCDNFCFFHTRNYDVIFHFVDSIYLLKMHGENADEKACDLFEPLVGFFEPQLPAF